MAGKKIKFTGVIKRFGGKSGGKEMLISQLRTENAGELLDLATVNEKVKDRIQGTIELIQEKLPGTT